MALMSAVDSPRGSAPARWEREEIALPANVAVLRHAVTDFARELGLPDQLVGDIALAVSEAATNAVMHAYVDREPGRLTVVAEPGRRRADDQRRATTAAG